MPSILDPLVDKAAGVRKGTRWYQQAVASIADRVSARRLMSQGKLNGRPSIGRLNMFFYDPKYKKTLPYYDTFPLAIIVGKAPGGFHALNLHYLPPKVRAIFLDKLNDVTNNQKFDDSTKFKITYKLLQSTKNYKYFAPCYKHYLTPNVTSNVMKVNAAEWNIAIFLQTAAFRKKSQRYIWGQSRRKY